MSETITFNIEYENDKIKNVELDQQSKDKLSKDDQQKFEDLGTSLINGILAGLEEGSRRVFEFVGIPKIVNTGHMFKLVTITLGIDYAMYLAEEKEKYGDNGYRNEMVAFSQTVVGWIFSGVGATGGALVGNIPGDISGAVSASIIYDVKNIGGKPASEWIGDAARTIYDRYHETFETKEQDKLSFSSEKLNNIVIDLLRGKHSGDNGWSFSAKSNSNDGFNWEGSSPTLNPSGSPQSRKPSAGNNPNSESQSSSGFKKPFTSFKDAFKDTIFEDLRNEPPSAGPSSTPSNTPFGNDNAGAGFKAGASYTSFKAPFSPPSSGSGNSGASPQPPTNFNNGHNNKPPAQANTPTNPNLFSFFKNTNFKIQNIFNQPIFQPAPQTSFGPSFNFKQPTSQQSLEARFNQPFKPNNLINEPGWLYQSSLGRGDDHFSKYLQTKTELRLLVSSCLSSVTCSDSSSTLIEKAKSLSGFSYGDFYSLSKDDVKSAVSSSFSFFRDIRLSKFSQGFWTHPLKEELGFAVSHVSPLVLDLDNDGIELLPYTEGVYFDIDNDGFAEKVGWTRPDDGQLARDLDGNGKIDDITELFGDDLISAFLKLSLLDSNGDKIIDEQDENFKELLVWRDKNSNGYSEAGELKTLKEAGIKSISLVTEPDNRIIEGNTISETARFSYIDGRTGEIADVHYHNDDMDSWFKEKNASSAPDFSIYKNELKQFRKQVFKALNNKINNTNKFEEEGDWVAKVIGQQAEAFVTKIKVKKELAGKNILDLANEMLSKKTLENKQKYAQLETKLLIELKELYQSQRKDTQNSLLIQMQKNLDREIADISSFYLQENNKKKEVLLKTANENLKQANERTLDHASQNRVPIDQYNRHISDNKARIERELQNQQDTWNKHYANEFTIKKAEIKKKYQELYNKRQQEVNEELVKQFNTKQIEKLQMNKQLSTQDREGLLKLIYDQYQKQKISIDKYIENLRKALEETANKVYDFIKVEAFSLQEDANAYSNKEKNSQFEKEPAKSKEFYAINIPKWLNEDFFASKQNTSLENYLSDEGIKIDPETLFMPLMRGYGKIPSLHIAMSKDAILKSAVMDLMLTKVTDFAKLYEKITNILYSWAGIANIAEDTQATAAGNNIELRKLAFVEQITGQEFKQLGAAKFVGQHASTAVQKAWDLALMRATKNLLIQGPLSFLFPKAEYLFLEDKILLNDNLTDILKAAKEIADKNSLKHDFWVQLGYILASHIKELKVSIQDLNKQLSDLAGEQIFVGLDNFSLVGDDHDNHIVGTMSSDYIKGLGGNDRLEGREGSDLLDGGDGDDTLFGGDGIDRIHGGRGNDIIYGGRDKDFIYGEEGDDEIFGEEGDDHIEGGPGADRMDGGSGNNTLSYGKSPGGVKVNLATRSASGFDAEGDKFKNFINLGGSEFDDYFVGDDNDNDINGEGGDDQIYGGKGNDHLFGATGEDRLYGEDGDDTLTGFEGPDHMDGGDGVDTADYHHPYSTAGVRVDLSSGKGIGGYAHGDTYINIENVKGSKFNDVIIGDDKNNKLLGMEGDDEIHGEGGDDIIIDLQGRNRLHGDEGDDLIISGGHNICVGGNGTDTISYQRLPSGVKIDMQNGITTVNQISSDAFTEFENAIGTNADDTIIGDEKDNRLFGLKGNDIIYGGNGDDQIHPGDGDDKIYGEKGDDHIMGSRGEDFYDGGEGLDTVDYSQEPDRALELNLKLKKMKGATFAQRDTLENIERIIGTKFNDIMIGDKADNHLYGHDGDDEIYGGDGNDILCGGEGKNKLYGEDGNNIFIIGKGTNFVYGGSGTNKVIYLDAISGVEINLSIKQGKKSSGELDIFEEIHNAEGSNFDDQIYGDSGMNNLRGLEGNDYIDGGAGSDTIDGGSGKNKLFGAEGNDKFLVLEGENTIDGGSGIDTVIYESYLRMEYLGPRTSEYYIRLRKDLLPSYPGQKFEEPIVTKLRGVKVSLLTGVTLKPNGLKDNLTNIENIDGTHYNDILEGNDQDNVINGFNGDDIIITGDGNDKVDVGLGHSKITSGNGDNVFTINKGTVEIKAGKGNNACIFNDINYKLFIDLEIGFVSYNYGKSFDFLNVSEVATSNGDDSVFDSSGDNFIKTGEGDDLIRITDGFDRVDSGQGNDKIIIAGSGIKELLSGSGDDVFIINNKDLKEQKLLITIGDFSINNDVIDLSQFFALRSYEDLSFEQSSNATGDYVIFSVSNDITIALVNTNLAMLSGENFIFVDQSELIIRDILYGDHLR